MLQDPNVERYVANAVKPLKKEIEQMKAKIEALYQALRIHDVVGRSEQCCSPPEPYYLGTTCPKCKKPFRRVNS